MVVASDFAIDVDENIMKDGGRSVDHDD